MQIELEPGKRAVFENDEGTEISLCVMPGEDGSVLLTIEAPGFRLVREQPAPRMPARASRQPVGGWTT